VLAAVPDEWATWYLSGMDDGPLVAFLGGPSQPKERQGRGPKDPDLKRTALEMYDRNEQFRRDVQTRSLAKRVAHRLFPDDPDDAERLESYIRRWVRGRAKARAKAEAPERLIEERWTTMGWLRDPPSLDAEERKRLIEQATRPRPRNPGLHC
jgi:hypothetical protein